MLPLAVVQLANATSKNLDEVGVIDPVASEVTLDEPAVEVVFWSSAMDDQ